MAPLPSADLSTREVLGAVVSGTWQGPNDPLRGRVFRKFFIHTKCFRCGLPLSEEGNHAETWRDPDTGEERIRPVHFACAQTCLKF